jgi:hypothetical protein
LLLGDLNPTKSVATRGSPVLGASLFVRPDGDSVGAERTVVVGILGHTDVRVNL